MLVSVSWILPIPNRRRNPSRSVPLFFRIKPRNFTLSRIYSVPITSLVHGHGSEYIFSASLPPPLGRPDASRPCSASTGLSAKTPDALNTIFKHRSTSYRPSFRASAMRGRRRRRPRARHARGHLGPGIGGPRTRRRTRTGRRRGHRHRRRSVPMGAKWRGRDPARSWADC